jgi:hypothetical protein
VTFIINEIRTGNFDKSLMEALVLVRKKNSENSIKGNRPISLLNDYKLFSRIIKTQLEKLVPLIVSDRQAACNRSRNIMYALCHVRDKLLEITHKKCNSLMISFDHHAFNRVSHHFLLDLFAKFNINIHFIALMTRMLDNRQGEPLSML